jgi:hypothetical protein
MKMDATLNGWNLSPSLHEVITVMLNAGYIAYAEWHVVTRSRNDVSFT